MIWEQSLTVNMLVTVLGTVLGGFISALVTWFFYRKSSENLRQESKELRKINEQEKELLQQLAKAINANQHLAAKTPSSRRLDEQQTAKAGKIFAGGDNITVLILPPDENDNSE
ncbi:MAG: hypothetical protein SCK29_06270 [Bacillota bacterium]|nr:hypothetical protein [Bacillota bacterium]MDW7683713.1 hypothetical protein [Bacillota bacterium]